MSEWFKKNLHSIADTYRNTGNSVSAPEPEEPGLLDGLSDLAGAAYHGALANTGNMIHTANDAMALAGKPGQYTDAEWMEMQTPLAKSISEFGRELEAEHERTYAPWSPERIVYGVSGVLPYALGLGATGAALARTGNYNALSNAAYSGALRLLGNPRAASLASKAIPAATYGTAMKAPESLLEGQGAYDEYVEEAKRNGTYIPNITEQEAGTLSNNVMHDNLALLSGTGALEEYLLASAPGGSFAKSALKKILGGSAINAGEEMTQQVFPKAESGREWSLSDEDVLESGLIGAIAGGGMQGGGLAYNALSNNHASEQDDHAPSLDQTWNNIQRLQSEIAGQEGARETASSAQIPQEARYTIANEVSNPTVTDLTEQKLRLLDQDYYNKYGRHFYITSMSRDGNPDDSWHNTGQAFDTADDFLESNAEARDWLIERGKAYGLYGLDEYENPSEHATGGHIHFSDHGEELSGDSGNVPSGQREGNPNAWAVYDVFKQAGYSDNAIAGILGRVQHEHSFDTSDVEEHWDYTPEGEKVWVGGYGMFQWNGGRTTEFLNWAQKNGLDPQNPTVQAQYALIEAQQRGLTPEAMNGLTHEQAADKWTKDWEVGRPGDEHQYAGEWLERIQKGGSAKGSQSPTGSMSERSVEPQKEPQKIDTYDDELNSMYEGFIREQLEASRNPEDIALFDGMFTEKGKFRDTEENIEKIRERVNGDLAEDFNDYVQRQRARQQNAMVDVPSGAKSGSRETPQIEIETGNLDTIKKRLQSMKEDAVSRGDFDLATKINKAVRTNNVEAMQELAGVQTADALESLTAPATDATKQASPSGSSMPQTQRNDFLSGLGIDSARLEAERQNIRDMHYKQLAVDEASSGNVPRLDRAINSDYEKAAGNMAMAGYQGANGWERGLLGARLEAALKNPATAQQAQEAIRQMQAEDEAAYLDGDIHVQEGAGKSRKPVLIRSRDGGLTEEAQRKYFQKDWQSFADREGYRPSGQPAPHTVTQRTGGTSNENTETTSEETTASTQNQGQNAQPEQSEREEAQAVAYGTSPRPAEASIIGEGIGIPSQEGNASVNGLQSESAQTSNPSGSAAEATEFVEAPVENPENLSLSQVNRRIRKLKKARQKDIDEEVERMKRTPGGRGVTIGYTHDEYGNINGRWAESNNPEWYQRAYKKYGRKPPKYAYPEIAEESLKDIQEFGERDMEIERLERLRRQLKEQSKEQAANGGGGKSAQSTAKAANEGGGQKTKSNEKIGSLLIGKDGKKFTATPDRSLDESHTKDLATLAENLGGKREDEAFSFKTARDRDAFTEVANAYIVLLDEMNSGKASATEDIGRTQKIVRSMRIVPQKSLGKQANMLASLGEAMGCPVVWVDADSSLNGVYHGNVAFLNRNAGMDITKTFWHEQFHWIKANNEALYKELLSYFKGRKKFTKDQIDRFRRDTGRHSLGDDAVIEEILADEFMDVSKRIPMLREMAGEKPTLAQRFVAWVKRMMDRVAELFHNPDGRFTTAQRDAFVEGFGKLAGSMKDSKGKPLFKTYQNGRRITLANGDSLDSVLDDDDSIEITARFSLNLSKDDKNRGDGIKFSLNLNSNTNEHSGNQGASSMPGMQETSRKWLDGIANTLAKNLHLKGDRIITEEREKGQYEDITLKQYLLNSPSRIADKVQSFRLFFRMGDRAMNKLTKLRSDYQRKYDKAMKTVKGKEDRESLFRLLWTGDMDAKEYGELTQEEKEAVKRDAENPNNTTKELREARIQKIMDEADVSHEVADAYLQVRQMMTKAYHMLNNARRQKKTTSERMTEGKLEKLRDNKFVEIVKVHEPEADGKRLVTYSEYGNHEQDYRNVTQTELDRMKQDDAIQVLSEKPVPDHQGGQLSDAFGNLLFDVKTREGIPAVNKRKGYIPHFFHEYMIRVKDEKGNVVGDIIESARTEREAVKIAEEWKKTHELKDGETIYISPKSMNFEKLGMKEGDYGVLMGDKDFQRMQKSIADNNDMSLEDAKQMLDGSVRLKNRHRFFGNFLQRKGAKGFEQDMEWVLRHYFNSASRYAAMETEFKPKAISLFERLYGSFDKDYNDNALAQYTKEYINDINGTPSTMEKLLNDWFNKSSLYRKFMVPTFGDRAALGMANAITSRVSYMTLGMLNLSSALLNFTQVINIASYLGTGSGTKNLVRYMAKAAKGDFTLAERRILAETGVLNDIGLDSGNGYDKNRGYSGSSFGGVMGRAIKGIDQFGNFSMKLFQAPDMMCRVGAVLSAYTQAISQGKSRDDAIKYAKEINRKANFDYGVNDAPNLFRRGSVFSQLALQFKKYGFKEMEIVGEMAPALLGGSKTATTKQKAIFWGTYFLICGLMGVPMLDWLDDLLGEKTGVYPKDKMQKLIMEAAGDSPEGKAVASMAMYGILAGANINVSSRASLADVIPTRTSDLAGPSLSKSYSALTDSFAWMFGNGNGAQVLRDFSPGLYNFYAAAQGEAVGSRDRLMTRYDTAMDKVLRAVGFKSVDESIPADVQRIVYNERDKTRKEKQRAIDAYLKEPTAENRKRLDELHVKMDSVKKEAERKKSDRSGRTEAGLTKEERERFKELLNFTKRE